MFLNGQAAGGGERGGGWQNLLLGPPAPLVRPVLSDRRAEPQHWSWGALDHARVAAIGFCRRQQQETQVIGHERHKCQN